MFWGLFVGGGEDIGIVDVVDMKDVTTYVDKRMAPWAESGCVMNSP